MAVRHLDNHARVLGKECLHYIAILAEVEEIDVQTAGLVGEAHLQQGGNHTTGTDVMSGSYPSTLDHLLYSHEGITEIFRILHRGHIVTHLA